MIYVMGDVMSYESIVIPLLTMLVGKDLESISGKANLKLISINADGYTVQCADGVYFNENHNRAKTVYNDLIANGVTHVEAALQNSGTRRNVPETLLANLPFINHTKISGRKNLVLKGTNTHLLGTLQFE